MQLVKRDNRYVAVCGFDMRHVPKEAGFRWDPTAKQWWTDKVDRAAKLAQYATPEVHLELISSVGSMLKAAEEAVSRKAESIAQSRATDDTSIDIPCPPGLAYLPYQRAGIAYASARPAALIGDDMGLGKTIQAIGVANLDPSIASVLIICPASLKLNWAREWAKWSVRKMLIGIANGSFFPRDVDVAIINFDIVAKNRHAIDLRKWDLLIVDEAHGCKNPKTQRTRNILGGPEIKDKKTRRVKEPAIAAIPARRRVFMSGTPIMNRPKELWPLVQSLDPNGLGANFIRFHIRYCNGHKTQWGWDFNGASNLDELQRKLRESIMIRRLKSEVLTDLPPKRRQIIEFQIDDADGVVQSEKAEWEAQQALIERAELEALKAEASGDDTAYQDAIAALRDAQRAAFVNMSKTRREVAMMKVPAVIEHLEEAIEASGKVVVFVHHIEVAKALAKAFGSSAVMLIGETQQVDRQAAVDRFQTDPTCTLFIGGIIPAGVGITLTASSHVVCAELDWRPGIVTQAEDRCHRIGQKDSVLVQHLVIDGSLDATMAKRIIAKQEVIDAALDNRVAPVEDDDVVIGLDKDEAAPATPQEAPGAVPAAAPRARPEPIVADLTEAQIELIQLALRRVAANDLDHARDLNGIGFSKIDGQFGHSLANASRLTQRQARAGLKLARKYRRQIGEDLMREIMP